MKRGVVTWALLMGIVASAAGAATSASTRVSVKPGSGTPQTHFGVSFRVPVATGTFGSLVRIDRFSAAGPRRAHCESRLSTALRPAQKGARITLTLRPGKRRGWCTGQWHGTIVQTEIIRCDGAPAHACPDVVVAPRTIASFRFRVNAARKQPPPTPPTPPASDVPTFAGLISAETCSSPGPALLPQAGSYTLTWNAATDPVTRSSDIVYEIFVASTPGGEDYATPTYTTSPGVTQFVTPFTPRRGPVYFVVRARNAAGHEDTNTVERQGVVRCTPTPGPVRPPARR
jgi:hypothetical protein